MLESLKKYFCQVKCEDAALECSIQDTGTGRRANRALCTLPDQPTLRVDKLGTL